MYEFPIKLVTLHLLLRRKTKRRRFVVFKQFLELILSQTSPFRVSNNQNKSAESLATH